MFVSEEMSSSGVPKLFMSSSQGVLIPSEVIANIIANFNLENLLVAVELGEAKYSYQEKNSESHAVGINIWHRSISINPE